MKRQGDYGYDAPYALFMFAAVGVTAAIVAVFSWWRHSHFAAMASFYGAFFLANAASFFYATRYGKFQVWDEIIDDLRFPATSGCSTWAAGAAPS